MRIEISDLTLLSLALSAYVASMVIRKEFLCFVFAGLFYGLLSYKGRWILMIGLTTHQTIDALRMFYGFPPAAHAAMNIMKSLMYYMNSSNPNELLASTKINFFPLLNNTLSNPVLVPLILIGMTATTICLIIIMLPLLLIALVSYAYMGGMYFLLKPFLLPNITTKELLLILEENPQLFVELVLPFLRWMFSILGIISALVIPIITYRLLRWIDFYKRIPKIRAFD